MQAYINYLLEDILNAERQEVQPTATTATENEKLEKHFAEIEQWIEREPVHTFGYYCGLNKEQFPPVEQLSENQLQQLNKAFRHLLFTWNLDVAIPENLPASRYYSLLVSVLDLQTDIVSSGFMTFEFCSYDTDSCPFGAYCNCKKFDNGNNTMNVDLPEGDMPF